MDVEMVGEGGREGGKEGTRAKPGNQLVSYASRRSRVGVGMNRSASGGKKCKAL